MNTKGIKKSIQEKAEKTQDVYHHFIFQSNKLFDCLNLSSSDIELAIDFHLSWEINGFQLSIKDVCECPYGGRWEQRVVLSPLSNSESTLASIEQIGGGTTHLLVVSEKDLKKICDELNG